MADGATSLPDMETGELVKLGIKRSFALFGDESHKAASEFPPAAKLRAGVVAGAEFARVVRPFEPPARALGLEGVGVVGGGGGGVGGGGGEEVEGAVEVGVAGVGGRGGRGVSEDVESQTALARVEEATASAVRGSRAMRSRLGGGAKVPQPKWHAPWELMRLISGETGAIRCVAVDRSNRWFVVGTANGTLVFYDLATGARKLTLTGHLGPVRAVLLSDRHPYAFSAGEDNTVRCWDLEANREIRKYAAHKAAVYALSLHPRVDTLVSGGRDKFVRVWDVRTRAQVHAFEGHHDAVHSLATQPTEPQIVSGGMDARIRMWDLTAAKCSGVLTHHAKGVRALLMHPEQHVFLSASADAVKKFHAGSGKYLYDFYGASGIQHCLALNHDGVTVAGSNDGTLTFWDYETGYRFQQTQVPPQPGSLQSEACIYAAAFDRTGSRLITGEADKTIKIWRPVPGASSETHPIDMEAWTKEVRTQKPM